MQDYTLVNLRDLENMSVKYGHGEHMEARFATKPLKLEKSGLGLQKVLPNKTIPFKHSHAVQEEVFIIIAGSGYMILEDEKIPLKTWDAIRVPAEVVRTVEAGSDGLEMLIVGAPYDGSNDAIMVRD